MGLFGYLVLSLVACAAGVVCGLLFARAGLLFGALTTLGLGVVMTTMAETLGVALAGALFIQAVVAGFVTAVIASDSGS